MIRRGMFSPICNIGNRQCQLFMSVAYRVKPVLSGHSKRRQKLVFKTDYRLMQVKSIAECSKGSILQYFRPSLSYHLPLRPLFCIFLSGSLRQVLLYSTMSQIRNVTVKRNMCFLNLCILMDLYIDTTSMGLPIVYLKGSQVDFSKLSFSVPEGCFTFDLILYVPVNNLSVTSGRVFLC